MINPYEKRIGPGLVKRAIRGWPGHNPGKGQKKSLVTIAPWLYDARNGKNTCFNCHHFWDCWPKEVVSNMKLYPGQLMHSKCDCWHTQCLK